MHSYSFNFAFVRLAFVEGIVVLLFMVKKVVDRFHVIVYGKCVFLKIEVEFVDGFVKGESVDDSFLFEILSEVQRPVSCHHISIIFN